MLQFLEWLDTKGFYVQKSWNMTLNKWVPDGTLELFPFQRDILGVALEYLPDVERFRYQRILYSTLMKSGKTMLLAAIGAWALEEFPAGTEIYVCANDQEQGEGRVGKAIKYHARKREGFYLTQWRIENQNGSFVQILAQHAASAAGNARTLVLWDELWGYKLESAKRMWSEMTPIPTEPLSMQVVATYAGYEHESDLLWDQYLKGVGREEHTQGKGTHLNSLGDLPCWENGRRFTYWDHEPRLPWQDQTYYDEAREDLRPADFLRFCENRWVTSHEAFIDAAWWDEAAKYFPNGNAETWTEHPYAGFPLYLGVDVGVKHDRTSAVAVAYDAKLGKIALVGHKIWTPVEGELFDLEGTVEAWLRRVAKRFLVRQIGYDPNQFHRSMVTLVQAGLPMQEFTQSPSNMAAASTLLFDLLRGRKFMGYPDDEARTHLRNAVAKDTGRGFRIVKDPAIADNKAQRHTKPVDFAIALAMACYLAVESGGVDTSVPVVWASPFSDLSQLQLLSPEEAALPFELRE